MQKQGWVQYSRDILDTDLWHDATTFRLYTYLLLKATHQDYVSVSGIQLKKGEWIRSYRNIARDLAYKEGRGLKEYSLQTIKKSIDKLVKMQKITIQQTEVGTLFTVLEHLVHQGLSNVNKESVNVTENELQTKCERTTNNNNNANNAKNANKKEYSPKQVYDESSVHYQLADLLLQRILKNNENFKKPNLQKWANTVRLMMERDNRTEEQIKYAIEWSQNDSFWKSNILSTDKLRKQFDSIVARIKADKEKKVTPFRGRNTKFSPSEEGKKRMALINNMTSEEVAELDRQLQKELEGLPY
ncbi:MULTISPECIES: hypothetical protein [Bacillus]|uniref:hypothetical protein n=1 Tax=Bacillus TaxID=1386 RepID=UPI0002DDB36A|nr:MULTISPECIES: hypothetical protein [Bacillus]